MAEKKTRAGTKPVKKKTAKKKSTVLQKKTPTAIAKTTITKRAKKPVTRIPAPSSAGRTGSGAFHIVGIGASAGGLEAFGQFFNHMPADSGMAFVLVPHLDPTHKSLIGELLAKYTGMKISQVRDGMKARPNNVYIIPPDKNIGILNGVLQLLEPPERRGLRHPIDFFFRSLAEDQRNMAVCIVLSGTGTEGALGLKAVKGEGGLVIVQDPATAKYDGMPLSSIDTGLVDYILPPEKIPEQLIKYVRGADKRSHMGISAEVEPTLSDPLQKIFLLIRNQTGHDFSHYKLNTIVRRIERRMTIHQIEKMDDYVTYLRDNQSEISMLFRELLIRVTNFFRDPKAFDVLKETVLPKLYEKAPDSRPLRVWVPACSTGEEAYSLAILFNEFESAFKVRGKVQIFATDIDNEAIERARSGIYPASISADVKKERLKNFFTKEGGSFRIHKRIREMVVFAAQNLIKDPPFSKIDLISCRNLMIYLGPHLQKKIIPLFHYSLTPGGILFLGSSESIGLFSDLFSVHNNKWKMFRPKKVSLLHMGSMNFTTGQTTNTVKTGPDKKGTENGEKSLSDITEKLLLQNYAPACVIISENGDIQYIHGRTGRYLEPSPGKARLNINAMTREGIRLEVQSGIRTVIAKKTDYFIENLHVKTNGGFSSVNVTIRYVREFSHLKGLIMVVFEDVKTPRQKKTDKVISHQAEKKSNRVKELEYELKSAREQIQTSVEELEASNEELQSTNEELQSANEELQSTNEELQTSKEELQSVNEELMTLNAESQDKIDELTHLSNDMSNLLAGTEIATVFLDSALNIKRYTPATNRIVNLIKSDIGRPLGDIASTLVYKNLVEDAQEVLKTLVPRETEVQDKSGNWFIVRLMPYRTLENVIEGVIATFVDITGQKQLQDELTDALHYSDGIVETIREPLLVLNADLRVVSANSSFYSTFKVTEKETVNKRIYDLGHKQWDAPKLKELLEKVLPKNTFFHEFKVEHDFPFIGKRTMLLNARRIVLKGRKTENILLAIEDVTHESR